MESPLEQLFSLSVHLFSINQLVIDEKWRPVSKSKMSCFVFNLNIQFTTTEEERSQKILTFNKLTSFSESNQLIDFRSPCPPLIFWIVLIDFNWGGSMAFSDTD